MPPIKICSGCCLKHHPRLKSGAASSSSCDFCQADHQVDFHLAWDSGGKRLKYEENMTLIHTEFVADH